MNWVRRCNRLHITDLKTCQIWVTEVFLQVLIHYSLFNIHYSGLFTIRDYSLAAIRVLQAPGDRKPAVTSLIEFCYKSVNLSLNELKHIIIIIMLFSNICTRTVQIAKFPEISHFLTNMTALSAVM